MPPSTADAPRARSFWIAVICGAVILTIGVGARQSLGIFQQPIAADLKVGRELWSFANALAVLLMGAFSPFVGNVADRFGTARTVAAGGVLYMIGMFMIAFAREGVTLTLQCAVRHRHDGCRVRAIFGAISRNTPPEKRSIALGIATAGGSFGQLAIVPLADRSPSPRRVPPRLSPCPASRPVPRRSPSGSPLSRMRDPSRRRAG